VSVCQLCKFSYNHLIISIAQLQRISRFSAAVVPKFAQDNKTKRAPILSVPVSEIYKFLYVAVCYQKSIIVKQGLIESRIICTLLIGEFYGFARVAVEQTCAKILEVISPYNTLLFKLKHILFGKLQNTVKIVFGIFKKSEQQLH